MAGKSYYITSLKDWKRRVNSYAASHWVALPDANADDASNELPGERAFGASLPDSTRILVVIESDEGGHASIEDDRGFEPLPHPLSHTPLSTSAARALKQFGVEASDSALSVTEVAGQKHPLLRYRVF